MKNSQKLHKFPHQKTLSHPSNGSTEEHFCSNEDGGGGGEGGAVSVH